MPSKRDILRWKKINAEKLHLPRKTVWKIFEDIRTTEKELCHLELSDRTRWMVQKGYVIAMVSAVEVYFRDMFDFMVKQHLKYEHPVRLDGLHAKRYSVDEMHSHIRDTISPYELVANSVNFQNYRAIEEAFDYLLGVKIWKDSKAVKITRHDGKELSLTDKLLVSFRRLLKLRHELIHQSFHADNGVSDSDKDCIVDTVYVIRLVDEYLIQHLMKNVIRDLPSQKKTSTCTAEGAVKSVKLN